MTLRVDASLPIGEGMPVWPGDGGVLFQATSSMAAGDSCNVTRISLGVHTGTHIDAPSHFVAGAGTVDAVALDALIGPAFVLDLPDVDGPISASGIAEAPECERLVLRTGNTRRRLLHQPAFREDYAHLDESAAGEIVRRGIRLIGVDYLSVEGFATGTSAVHDALLSAGVVAVEGLDLEQVTGGWWRILCLPLKLEGLDGSPARVVFERDS